MLIPWPIILVSVDNGWYGSEIRSWTISGNWIWVKKSLSEITSQKKWFMNSCMWKMSKTEIFNYYNYSFCLLSSLLIIHIISVSVTSVWLSIAWSGTWAKTASKQQICLFPFSCTVLGFELQRTSCWLSWSLRSNVLLEVILQGTGKVPLVLPYIKEMDTA